MVSSDKSYLLHNHAPAEALKKDANWRPTVKNAAVRAALGLDPLESRSRVQVRSIQLTARYSLTLHCLCSGFAAESNSLDFRRTTFEEAQIQSLPIRLFRDFTVFAIILDARDYYRHQSLELTSLKLFSLRFKTSIRFFSSIRFSSIRFLFDPLAAHIILRSALLDASISINLEHGLDFSRSNSFPRTFPFLPSARTIPPRIAPFSLESRSLDLQCRHRLVRYALHVQRFRIRHSCEIP